jgi:transposase
MRAPITLPPVDITTLAELRRRDEDTPHIESRTRYQMLLLAQQDDKVPQLARIVLRSADTGVRVLKRFLAAGLDAVPRRTPPGRERRVTAARARRVTASDRVGSRTPVGMSSANWITDLLAEYLGQHTGIQVTQETVRVYLHANGYGGLRPTWTLRRKAAEQAGYVGKDCG